MQGEGEPATFERVPLSLSLIHILDQEGRPNRWRVENSWGKKLGRDGYFVMTDDWFSEYVYQVVVHINAKGYERKLIL